MASRTLVTTPQPFLRVLGRLFLILAGPLAVGYAAWQAAGPPAPATHSAPPESFSAGRALAVLGQLMGEGRPHPIGSAEQGQVRDRLLGQLAALGLESEVQSRFVCGDFRAVCGEIENIVARRLGSEAGPSILINTHYDTMPATPGAGDSMAAVAAMLEAARALATQGARRHTLVWLFNDGEEAGLLGSTAFVRHHPWARDVGVVINLDARGNRGPVALAAVSGASLGLIDSYRAGVAQPAVDSTLGLLTTLIPNTTDLEAFEAAGLSGGLLGFVGGPRVYHSRADTLSRLDLGTLQHLGDSLLGWLREADRRELRSLDPRPAVALTVFDRVVCWPRSWMPAASAALLIFWAWAVAGELRRAEAKRSQLLWGFFGVVLALGLGLVFSLALNSARKEWFASPAAWIAHHGLLRWAAIGSALAAAGLASALLGQRARAAGWSFGVGLVQLLLLALAALLRPEVALLLLVPWAGATVGGRLASRWIDESRTRGLIGAMLMAAVWAMPARFLDDLGGAAASTVFAVVFVLPATLAATSWVGERRSAWLATVAGLLLAVSAFRIAARQPVFSPEQPQFFAVVGVVDADRGQGRWIATGYPVPPPLVALGGFTADSEPVLPWSRQEVGPVGADFDERFPAPEVEILENVAGAAGRRVRARLRSPRGAPWLQLGFTHPGERAPVAAVVKVGGETVPASQARYALYDETWAVTTVWPLPADGIEVELEFATLEPVAAVLADRSFGLPAEGQALDAARPPWAEPHGLGDGVVVRRTIRF